MPPASRGQPFLRYIRHYATVLEAQQALPKEAASKTRLPKIPRLPERAPPRKPPKQEPEPKAEVKPEIPQPGARTQTRRSILGRIRDRIPPSYRNGISKTIIYGPIAALVWMHFPLEIMWTNGGSMSPFFNPNSSPDLPETKDKLLVARFPPLEYYEDDRRVSKLAYKRGQIVVFSTPHDPNKIAVKRIVALPGDRVQPLPGGPGGEDPVVVQYNHVWVEGDVDDRNRSIDSNWYGPISQNLIVGTVKAVMEPWYRPTFVNLEEHTYPAKAKGRVEENAVADAAEDPDLLAKEASFLDGRITEQLEFLRANRIKMPRLLKIEANRRQAADMYTIAQREVAKRNPQTLDEAEELIEELSMAFLRAGLRKDGTYKKTVPATQKEVEEGPAKKALREYMERQKKEKEAQPAQDDERPIGLLVQMAQEKKDKEAAERATTSLKV